ncbi:MAG: metal ABC transporter substrate-binding protein [Thermoanaerobaculia bacterium]|nr:metal ABC transporter substrate-binding protein [Thermoanaerobaculia bacterium]
MKDSGWVRWLPLVVALWACGGGEVETPDAVAEATGPLAVYTVNYPLAYLAERVGGDAVEVVFPVPPGVDPAHWTPSADVIGRYQGADVILLSGAGYAQWVETAALPGARLVDTSYEFTRPFILRDQAVTHSHGPMGMHSHKEMAAEVWLDLTQAIAQAERIAATFAERRPQRAVEIEERLAALRTELEELDAEMAAILEPFREAEVVASHPAYDYLARRYALDLEAVTWEPDEAPTAEMWAHFDERLAHAGWSWMLWHGEPLPETRAQLAERGVEVVVFEPLANRPDEGDFVAAMRRNVDNLRAALAD